MYIEKNRRKKIIINLNKSLTTTIGKNLKKIEGKIKLMMKILLYRTEPCWLIS